MFTQVRFREAGILFLLKSEGLLDLVLGCPGLYS